MEVLNMNYYKSISNDRPQVVDNTSSPTTVYLRKNIEAVEVKDVETGNTRIEYHYDETAISKDEYIDILRAQIEDNEAVLAEMLFGGEDE
jgi:hypothetical protein